MIVFMLLCAVAMVSLLPSAQAFIPKSSFISYGASGGAFGFQRQQVRRRSAPNGCRMEVFEGNPLGKWVWENVWHLPLFKRGDPGQSPCTFGDSANIFRTNIEQKFAECPKSFDCRVHIKLLNDVAAFVLSPTAFGEGVAWTLHAGIFPEEEADPISLAMAMMQKMRYITFQSSARVNVFVRRNSSVEAPSCTVPHPEDTVDTWGLEVLPVVASNPALIEIYGDEPSVDGCPLAEGELESAVTGNMFVGLRTYYEQFGPAYKLCFGPKSFIVISDPMMARHILRDNPKAYDKGILAEILAPIMGKGLIPADPETWSVRRRAIVPGFHKAWLNAMIKVFVEANEVFIGKLGAISDSQDTIEMESNFCSVSLDIIGKSIFNYKFNSVSNESPVIQSVYSVLKEAEHRSMTPAPYWELPLANQLVPRLRKFNNDLRVLNEVLTDLITRARNSAQKTDLEDLQSRNYDKVSDPSMLRFLVDLRGEDATDTQLRDDLMTMLIAGHETTAALLTWAFFEMAQNPAVTKKAQEEVDRVLGDRVPTLDDIKSMKYIRRIVAESLRMYPQPPLLIRRALEDDVLPPGAAGPEGHRPRITRGCDIFIAIYNIHRSANFWENADTFDPDRFIRPFNNPGIKEWGGYNPDLAEAQLYPNEVASDFAFLPFGGGQRKCVGDQFALMESVVTLAMLTRRFEFELAMRPEDVGFFTGATIHTRNGLHMRVRRRVLADTRGSEREEDPDRMSVVPEPAAANSTALPAYK